MTSERSLALALLVVSGVLFSALARPAWRVWRIYSGTKRRRQQDARGSAPLPTPETAARLEALMALGFDRAGETYVELPDVGPRFAWQLVHADREIYAVIVPTPRIGALTAIYSAWRDGTWLSTMNPIGETIGTDEGLVVQAVPGAVDAAFDAHQRRSRALRARHGAPRRVESLADILVLDGEYRTRYGGRTLIRRTRRMVVPALLAGLLLVLSLVLLTVTAR